MGLRSLVSLMSESRWKMMVSRIGASVRPDKIKSPKESPAPYKYWAFWHCWIWLSCVATVEPNVFLTRSLIRQL